MKLGFVGCGNMAAAIISGLVENRFMEPLDIFCYDIDSKKMKSMTETYGLTAADGAGNVAVEADVVVLAVKPRFYSEVIAEMREYSKSICVVSLAPGISLDDMAEDFNNPELRVIRTMPNTPAMAGEGMTAICKGTFVTDRELSFVRGMFDSCGKTEMVPEYLMDAVVAVSGSSPAYVFMFIEALADGAVAQGMPRDQAYTFAAQAVMGSAKLMLETGKHPGELKDMVCSPGGTTIAAVQSLERSGMRGAVMEAMSAIKRKIEADSK